ncbi:MAG: hypothetical protein R3357_02825 [Burkholderiales bacterium]|nr:hypothetical protein [Burkholderiales bacterium]
MEARSKGERAFRALAVSSLAAVLLAATPSRAQDPWVVPALVEDPDWDRFSVCYDNGCTSVAQLGFTGAERDAIRAILEPAAPDAAAEREQLRAAVAQIERFVGARTGTSRDRGGTFNFVDDPQMDCIDESTNTTTYLAMLRRNGLLRHHDVAEPATRGWFVFGWPHSTAVVRERASGAYWAVDSWFLDNGEPPFILPLEVWRRGWRPEDPVAD